MKPSIAEILVVGAGAIGIYFAGRLAQTGCKVSVVARSDYEALRRNGGSYLIDGEHGDFSFKPERVLRSVSEMPVEPDLIIVALKLLPGCDPVELCRPAVAPKSSFLIIQNGLGSDEAFAKAYPGHEVVGSIAYIGASRPEPGRVHQQDSCHLTVGTHPKGITPLSKLIAESFEKSGVECKVSDDIVMARWRKLLWNAPYNPISVLGNHADIVSIMSEPEAAALAEDIMVEIAAIATAEGHPIARESIDSNLNFTRGMSAYKTSMLQDFEAGRPLEVEAILGDPIRIAGRNGTPVPKLKALYALLKLADRAHGRPKAVS